MRRLNALFKDNAELVALSAQAGNLTASQKNWEAVAPDSLKQLTQAGSIKHKRLTVYADNGAVATKIKMLLPSLLTKLQKQGVEVTSIRVEVQVKSGVKNPVKTLRNLSPEAASSLGKLAAELGDSALGEALARLSGRK
jgi:hypothetical protein